MKVLDISPVTGGSDDIRRALVQCIEAINQRGWRNVGIPVRPQAVSNLCAVFDEHGYGTQPHSEEPGSLVTVEVWEKSRFLEVVPE
ncbi:hypothetical protein A3A64_01375 [Candidatus Gottesmanbacteria bacterium RIFCSPLOWO2_01_FULL_48_11]|uniref:Uncharacterized protein n=3 Tax=Patescibacteria group TaxID=1783273 RepID=A0A1F6ARQ8_9BACT|nr:MAG: hypothetical protein UX29_C0008G0007 [Parcubacteria group bacterium GW2011_GWA2_46_10]KKU21900.1 MAG: hypothetical protein UX31_C0010G0031 [Candidatus Nomurabacteria bacterium GW2011_GWA1_46_11]OGG27376.1 MAG: hypothetical protein A3A64_01375 [Candidatus Gottesmanbacteria bacterium RIFCSPLOWO2_01_FULL_48_11]OGY56166.1 MAG: hypothetical protein A2119_00850 [Candidatus Colwellbacteria bacterium GWA2_46_10]